MQNVNSVKQNLNNAVTDERNVDITKVRLDSEIEQNKKREDELDKAFANIDLALEQFSNLFGKRIDTTSMVVQILPAAELKNSKVFEESCKSQSISEFDELLDKLQTEYKNINVKNSSGMTLLMYALKHGFWHGVDKLLDLGADVNIIDNNNNNALMYACVFIKKSTVLKILEVTKDINVVNKKGNTALHHLCMNIGHASVGLDRNELDIGKDAYISGYIFCGDGLDASDKIVFGAPKSIYDYTTRQGIALDLIKVFHSKNVNYSSKNNIGLMPIVYLYQNRHGYVINKLQSECNLYIKDLDETGFQAGLSFLFLGDTEKLQEIIRINPKCLIEKDKEGDALLHYAVRRCELNPIKILIDNGANINMKGKSDYTALHYACVFGEDTIVEFLLANNANPNICGNDTYSPVLTSARNNNIPILNQLLNCPIPIDLDLQYSFTLNNEAIKISLLYFLVNSGNENVVDLLIKKGANLDLAEDVEQKSPTHIALIKGYFNIATKLINAGANPNSVTKASFSLLYAAAQVGNAEILQLLINKEANVNFINDYGCSALQSAVVHNFINLTKILMENNANQNTQEKSLGLTPLFTACYNGNNKIAQYLIGHKNKPDLSILSNNKKNLLMWAAKLMDINILNKIIAMDIDKRININQQDDNGRSLLWTMAHENWLECLVLLLKNKANPNLNDNIGCSPLHGIARHCNVDGMLILLDNGADINAQDNQQQTPLYVCIKEEDFLNNEQKLQAVQFLLDNGALTTGAEKTIAELMAQYLPEALPLLESISARVTNNLNKPKM